MVTDKTRIPKMLHTAHPSGVAPIVRTCETEHHEASFIAMEIKRVIAHMGGTLRWGDFVILRELNHLFISLIILSICFRQCDSMLSHARSRVHCKKKAFPVGFWVATSSLIVLK